MINYKIFTHMQCQNIFFVVALFILVQFILVQRATTALACDLSYVHSGTDHSEQAPNTFRIGVTEQFTSFGKLQESSRFVENSSDQYIKSSTGIWK